MLKSENVILRAIEESDLDRILAWRNDPSSYDYFYEFLPISSRQQMLWFEAQIKNPNEINFIIALADGKAVGMASIYNIDRRNRKAEWGRLILDKDCMGRGIGVEALLLLIEYSFQHLNLHKLYCEVLETNSRAIALYKKLGLVEEGLLRDHAFKSGRYVNAVIMSMLDVEYFASLPRPVTTSSNI